MVTRSYARRRRTPGLEFVGSGRRWALLFGVTLSLAVGDHVIGDDTIAGVPTVVEKSDGGEETELVTGDLSDMPSFWDTSFTLRAWSGFRDNPLLSSVNPTGSGFVAGGGEVMVFRLPMDGWEVSVFGVLERLEYFESELMPETTGIVDARTRRSWENGWSLGLGLEYFYLKQVFDASELEGVPVVIRTEGHTLGVRPLLGKTLGKAWRLEVEFEWGRQWLDEPLDGYRDVGTRVQGYRVLREGSELGVSYRYRDRGFDTRTRRDSSGVAIDGILGYRQHEWESIWRASWGPNRRWRTWVRAGWGRSTDNGGGYFDYDRFQVGGQVRWVGKVLELRAEARARWYLYPAQRASEPDGPERRRTGWTTEVRGDWKFDRKWRLFGQYEWDVSDENVSAADYRAMGVHLGLEWEL